MASSRPTLEAFIQTVPVCEATVPLATVLTLLQSTSQETLAIVSPENLPLGVVPTRVLFSHLARHQLNESLEANKSLAVAPTSSQESNDLTPISLEALMEPAIVLPAKTKVSELGAYLPTDNLENLHYPTCALVDEQGKFLGLLNHWRLLQYFCSNKSKSAPKNNKIPISSLQQFLFQFLEQFPLPLTIQTDRGQVLHANLQWSQQLGEYIPFENGSFCLLKQEHLQYPHLTPSTLGKQAVDRAKARETDWDLTRDLSSDRPSSRLQLLEEEIPSNVPSLDSSVEETPSNTAEKIWQFIKLPLNFWGNLQPKTVIGKPYERSQVWLILATDVTEQYRLCQELGAKNTDLVQLNRLKDEFLACISHELKSPLTAVLGLSSILKDRKVGDLNQRQTHYAELIYQSGHQLMTLVNDLLDLTRLETGQLKLKSVSVPIKIACEQAYGAIEKKYKSKIEAPISFTLEIEPGLDTIVADELRLHQMLVHLLDNAVKFSQGKDPIGLRVNHWENWIAFTIWDRGIGIPEEHQHLIFQKFQQLESPLTRQFEGMGLGLVLTQHLARAHGGDISFISQVDRGSQFTLLLPPSPMPKQLRTSKFPTVSDASQPPSTATANLQSLIPRLHEQRHPLVLVVETRARAVEDLAEKLRDLGYRVAIARSGTEALDKARRLHPHTIFLNPALPLLSGWDVLKLLKANQETKDYRIIITGTHGDKSLSEENGANGFLSLPVESKVLATILPKYQEPSPRKSKSLTILRLYPAEITRSMETATVKASLDLALASQLSQLNHRIVEADDLEQAEIVARVWDIDVVVLDGSILEDPLTYLRSFSEYSSLVSLPLVTLDVKTTEAANQVGGLSVFPCLVPTEERNFNQFLQVIQIAAGINANS